MKVLTVFLAILYVISLPFAIRVYKWQRNNTGPWDNLGPITHFISVWLIVPYWMIKYIYEQLKDND